MSLPLAHEDRLLVFRAQAVEDFLDDCIRIEGYLVVDDGLSIRGRVLHIQDDFDPNDAGPIRPEELMRVIVQALPALAWLAQHDLQVSQGIEQGRLSRCVCTVDCRNGQDTGLSVTIESPTVATLLPPQSS